VPYLLGEYRERAPERRLRRPYRDRTGVLLIESQASVPLLRRPKVLLRPSSNRDPPGFSRALYLLSLAGMSVCGAEGARTPGLRSAEPALNLLSYSPMSPEPGIEPGMSCSQSRRVTQLPRSGSPGPAALAMRAADRASFVMPSAVEFSNISTTGHAGVSLHGRQESNPQRTALETVALPN
jgi:hypothetical protein